MILDAANLLRAVTTHVMMNLEARDPFVSRLLKDLITSMLTAVSDVTAIHEYPFLCERLKVSGVLNLAVELCCNPKLSGSDASRRSTLVLLDTLCHLVESGNMVGVVRSLWEDVDLMPLSRIISENEGGRRRREKERRENEGEGEREGEGEGEEEGEEEKKTRLDVPQSKHQQGQFNCALRLLAHVVMSGVVRAKRSSFPRIRQQLTRSAVASIASVVGSDGDSDAVVVPASFAGVPIVQMLWTVSMIDSFFFHHNAGGSGTEDGVNCTEWYALPSVTPMMTENEFVHLLMETTRRREERREERVEEEVEEEEEGGEGGE